MPSPISPIPGKATCKQYEMQGWNARRAGHSRDDCPYFASSTAAKYWLRGFGS